MTDTVGTEDAGTAEFVCEICGAHAGTARHLGVHRRAAHGIAGTSTTAVRQRALKQRGHFQGSGSIIEAVVGYLDAYRGPHHFDDIAEAMGLDVKQVKNAVSKAKLNGQPIGSDGEGNWYWTKDLKVVASDRPRTTVSRELVPVPTTNGHKPQRVFRPVELGDDLELLETDAEDGSTSLWLATRIK